MTLAHKQTMAESNPILNLKLDPSRLVHIVDVAVIATTEVVNFHFNALSVADLNEAPASPEEAKFRLSGPKLAADQRRAIHERWILAKAFQELLRAVRHALEEAYVFTSVLNKKHAVPSATTLGEFLRPFQSKAASMRFPDLLAAVNEKLEPKLVFAEAYKSLQSARNCLEHRNGIIGSVDTRGSDAFVLSIPRMKIFYVRKGEEIELEVGHVVEPDDDQSSAVIMMKLDVRQRSVALGERLLFTLAEFNEIAFACHFLGQQLSTKLPMPDDGFLNSERVGRISS